jgi:5-methylcytosine-specific restriction endonuclease McrA
MKLPLPGDCSVALIDNIVREREGGVNAAYFSGICNEWRTRVREYVDRRGDPESVKTWPAIAPYRTRFLTLYNTPRENSVQHAILKRLRERKLQLCPSCGEEGVPNTLDHYLPKESYPHFAVTPANLTPMCDGCQGAKGTQTVDQNGIRIFLHPYFDDFLDVQVVRLLIGRPFEAPEDFILEADLDLPDEHSALVQRHIEGLELQRRYGAFFREEYVRLMRLAQEARSKGTDILEDIPRFKRLHELRNPNAWPHVFYAAVVEDEELLAYLSAGELPPML